jgi:uncharacterized protein YdaU (DUF1376 family)
MIYLNLHIGDWISGTMLCSALERGVYIDLLVAYYSKMRPLMRSECDRIERAYAEDEREAMEYVLAQSFTKDGDVYRNARADAEIAKCKDISRINSANARKGWEARRAASAKCEPDAPADATADATAYTTADANANATAYANAMLTSNQKPKGNSNVADKPRHTSHTAKKVHLSEAFDALTEEWRQYAKQTRPDLDPDKVFARFRFYWTSGKGGNRLRTVRGWTTSWQNWLKNEESDSDTDTDEAPADPFAVKATPVDGELALPQGSEPPMVDLDW